MSHPHPHLEDEWLERVRFMESEKSLSSANAREGKRNSECESLMQVGGEELSRGRQRFQFRVVIRASTLFIEACVDVSRLSATRWSRIRTKISPDNLNTILKDTAIEV